MSKKGQTTEESKEKPGQEAILKEVKTEPTPQLKPDESTAARPAEEMMRQNLANAREIAKQVAMFVDGDDIEQHLRKLDDVAELMLVNETVKYQAILLSMEESIRAEVTAWIKTENLTKEVRGNPEALKKRLLEKFGVRRSLLERIHFVTQPRREERRLVIDILERKRVYDELMNEMMQWRDKLLVEAALQMLIPEDRADYCNLRPEEAKRSMNDLLEFVRRKEEERLREEKLGSPKEKKEERTERRESRKEVVKKHPSKKRLDEEDEREQLMREGKCFICRKQGHRAIDCPNKNDEDQDVEGVKKARVVKCTECGQEGHTRWKCPRLKKELGREPKKDRRGSADDL